MNDEGITGVEPVNCLGCGRRMNALGPVDCAPSTPAPGDPVACIRCGAVMTYEAGKLRGFTEREMAELTADAEAMNHLAMVVKRIHFIRHGVN